MARKSLLALLICSLVFEVIFSGAALLAPEFTLGLFQVAVTPESLFLGFALGWTLIFIALVCAVALKLILAGQPAGHTLAYVLGFWWVAVGLALFLKAGRVDNLFADTLKGALIVAANYFTQKNS